MSLLVEYDAEVDAAYLALRPIDDGEAVEQVSVDRPGLGTVVLDFTAAGELVGVEVLGAASILPATLLAESRRL